MNQLHTLKADVAAPSFEARIVRAMEEDGFDPPYIGESKPSFLQKIAGYIDHLRNRPENLEGGADCQKAIPDNHGLPGS